MIYSSIDNEKIKSIKKLQSKKYRDIENLFIVEGDHLVKEAYNAGMLKTLIIEEDYEFSLEVEKIYCTDKVMKYLSELDTHKKVMGICYKRESTIKGNKILALDGVQDPGNLGTIIRSAVAFNVDTLILSEECVDLYNSKVIRASQGMLFHINIVVGNLKNILSDLKDYKMYGTKVDGGTSLSNVMMPEKFVVIMGNEGNGMSQEISDLCDNYIYIDMNNNCESLNVAVATSIILYELRK